MVMGAKSDLTPGKRANTMLFLFRGTDTAGNYAHVLVDCSRSSTTRLLLVEILYQNAERDEK